MPLSNAHSDSDTDNWFTSIPYTRSARKRITDVSNNVHVNNSTGHQRNETAEISNLSRVIIDRSVNEYTIPNDTDSAFNEMSNTGENEPETVNELPSTIPYSSDLSSFGLIKKGLRIGNLNVCHLLPKIDEIRLLLNEHRSVNILGLCETFLNDHIDNN